MDPIYPITAEHCSRFVGVPVCAVLHDGTRYYGILSRVENGKLILNDAPETELSANAPKKTKAKAKAVGKGKSAQTKTSAAADMNGGKARLSAFPYSYPYRSPFGARVALEIAAIALLFALFL